METRPVVVLNQGVEKNNASEYPPYSAYSRWPRLHPENRISKPTTPRQLPKREQQENFQQPRPKARPPAPPVNYAPSPTKPAFTEYDVNPGPGIRPDSLQEALLTIRTLKQVRPRITAIPDSYP